MAMYNHATAEPFSFMFVRLDAKTKKDMFWLRFEARISPLEESDADDGTQQHSGSLGNHSGPNEQGRKDRQGSGNTVERPQRGTIKNR